MTGPARVFTSERAAIAAIKGQRRGPRSGAGDVIVLIGRGPLGAGMEEVYQITSALKHLDVGKHVALITDARFSGVSTGPCIGHVGPEALAGGPIGALRDGDRIRIVIDRTKLDGTIDLVEAGPDGQDVAGHRNPGPAARPHRPRPGSRPAAGHAAVGRAADRQRRSLGRGGLRRRCDPAPPADRRIDDQSSILNRQSSIVNPQSLTRLYPRHSVLESMSNVRNSSERPVALYSRRAGSHTSPFTFRRS